MNHPTPHNHQQQQPLSFSPERLLLFHSPDPSSLGLQLVHSPYDGHVRIIFISSEEEIAQNGIVEGPIQKGDVVLEAAGVNMRNPISDHMWKLTVGLMRVAPRPIEVVVAQVVDDSNGVVGSEANDSGEEEMQDTMNGSYYQLEMGENGGRTPKAMMHHLPGSPGAISSASAQSSTLSDDGTPTASTTMPAFRNPFNDVGRFGIERRITFHTQSLGVKLHRSPNECIVHILHVTPASQLQPSSNTTTTEIIEGPVREGPNNGHLEAGDVILEVGGVDLRDKVIGPMEWADMVHFVKHIGRPLEMVVAMDNMFTPSVPIDNNVENKNGEQNKEGGVGSEEKEHEEQGIEGMMGSVCFNIASDDICNLPCATDDAGMDLFPCVKPFNTPLSSPSKHNANNDTTSATKNASPVQSSSARERPWSKRSTPVDLDTIDDMMMSPMTPVEEEDNDTEALLPGVTTKGVAQGMVSPLVSPLEEEEVQTPSTPVTPADKDVSGVIASSKRDRPWMTSTPDSNDEDDENDVPTTPLEEDDPAAALAAATAMNNGAISPDGTTFMKMDHSWIESTPNSGEDEEENNENDDENENASTEELPVDGKQQVDEEGWPMMTPVEEEEVPDPPPAEDAVMDAESPTEEIQEPVTTTSILDKPTSPIVEHVESAAAAAATPVSDLESPMEKTDAEEDEDDDDTWIPKFTLADSDESEEGDVVKSAVEDAEPFSAVKASAEPTPENVNAEPTNAGQGTPNPVSGDDESGGKNKKTVAQLREMFSPIQNPVPISPKSPVLSPKEESAMSPILKATTPGSVEDSLVTTMFKAATPSTSATEEHTNEPTEENVRANLNGLFSPIVMENEIATPKSHVEKSYIPERDGAFSNTPNSLTVNLGPETNDDELDSTFGSVNMLNDTVLDSSTLINNVPSSSLPSSPARRQSDSPTEDWSAASPIPEKSQDASVVNVTSPVLAELGSAMMAMGVSVVNAVAEITGSGSGDSKEKKEDPPSREEETSSQQHVTKRAELAQALVKEKRGSSSGGGVQKDESSTNLNSTEEQPASPSAAGGGNGGIQVPELEATPGSTATSDQKLEPTPLAEPPKPYDETASSSFHSAFLENLRNEFDSPDVTLQPTDSRDDQPVVEKLSNTKPLSPTKLQDVKISDKPEKRNMLLSTGWSSQQSLQQRADGQQSPTGSTISVEREEKKKSPSSILPATATPPRPRSKPFSERSFHAMDDSSMMESPFVGNIKFATPTQRVPASALFSQAFVVQHLGGDAGSSGEPTNTRWVQTDSPLFVVKKDIDNAVASDANTTLVKNVDSASTSPYLQFHSPPSAGNTKLQPAPPSGSANPVSGLNPSAFDMTTLQEEGETGGSLQDENGSFELNETIVYADSMELDAPGGIMDCCGVVDTICGSGDNMFEGLVSGTMGNSQAKGRRNRVQSPRRKNLLSRLRGKSKNRNKKNSSKQDKQQSNMQYGNLVDFDDDDNHHEERQEHKGVVRKAHVQLTRQNIRGKTIASASQFALLLDDEICV